MVWAGRKVPTGDAPGFNAEDPYADPVALLEHREYVVWEKEVKIEEAKVSLICSAPAGSSPVASVSPQSFLQILREKLKDCYLREGVNHYQNCRQVPIAPPPGFLPSSARSLGCPPCRSTSSFEHAVGSPTIAPCADG